MASIAQKDGVANSQFTGDTSKLVPTSGGHSQESCLKDQLMQQFQKQKLCELFLPPEVVAIEQHSEAPKSEKMFREVNVYTHLESARSQLVLIMGMSGTGKSSFTQRLAQDWCMGRALQEYSLVLFLPLAKVKSAEEMRYIENLASLFNLPEELNSQFGEIVSNVGKRVLIILDGWDEFVIANHHNWKRSIIASVLSRKVFSLATVIATTRPSALKSLYQIVDDRVDLHLEVVLFSFH